VSRPGEYRRGRRLPVGETLAEAMRLWWRDLWSFAALAVAVVAPLTIGSELLDHLSGPVGVQVTAATAVASLSVLGEVFCAGLAEHMARRRQLGLPAQSLWKLTRQIPFLRLCAVSVIVAVVVLCGLLLLVLPGLVAFAWLSLATPLVSFEDRRVWPALAGSVAAVRGHFWPVAVLTTATYIPTSLGIWASEGIEQTDAPLWVEVLLDIVTDALSVSLTAAVLVSIFAALRRATPRAATT
jgi:hypothetical protein